MQFKYSDKLVFEIKRLISFCSLLAIIHAFLLFFYWVIINMNFSLPETASSYFDSVVKFCTNFYSTSFYKMIFDIKIVVSSVFLGIIAYLLNCLVDIVDMIYGVYKKSRNQKRLLLERKINRELRKDFLSEIGSYNLMLVKIKINVESLSTYLTQHIDGEINVEEILSSINNNILKNLKYNGIVQKGKSNDFVYFLITNLPESKTFFTELVNVTKLAVNKESRPKVKITFLCCADLLTDIKEFGEKDMVTSKILDYSIENKIVATPAVHVYYNNLYSDLYDFSVLGEYNLSNESSGKVSTLYSIVAK